MRKYLLDDKCLSFSTDTVAPGERISYWHDVVRKKIPNFDCEPLQQEHPWFNGELRFKEQNDIKVAEVYSDPMVIKQSKSAIANLQKDTMLLSLRLNSSIDKRTNEQEQQEASDGDLTFYHCSKEQTLCLDGTVEALLIQIPIERLNYYFDQPEELNGVAIPHDDPFGKVIPGYMRGIVSEVGNMEPEPFNKMINNFLHLLSIALDGKNQTKRIDCEAMRKVQLNKILEYIRLNIDNPDLKPAFIAKKHNMSLRYLYNIFDHHHLTPSQYIQDERLNIIAQKLATSGRVKISEIAVKYGFSNFSHFSRTFKKKFGQTPRDYKVRESEKLSSKEYFSA